jgi:hypothetical protein
MVLEAAWAVKRRDGATRVGRRHEVRGPRSPGRIHLLTANSPKPVLARRDELRPPSSGAAHVSSDRPTPTTTTTWARRRARPRFDLHRSSHFRVAWACLRVCATATTRRSPPRFDGTMDSVTLDNVRAVSAQLLPLGRGSRSPRESRHRPATAACASKEKHGCRAGGVAPGTRNQGDRRERIHAGPARRGRREGPEARRAGHGDRGRRAEEGARVQRRRAIEAGRVTG